MSAIDVDFHVSSDPYHLKFMDLSNWGVIEGKASIIEITLPGYSAVSTYYWDQYKTNIFNSNKLGISCPSCTDQSKLPLADGIYEITVKGSPDTYFKTKYYLKTDLFEMEMDKLFIENKDFITNTGFQDKYTEVEFLLKGAEAHLNYEDIVTAGQLFETAQQALEDLTGCETCN